MTKPSEREKKLALTGADPVLWGIALESRIPISFVEAKQLPARELWQAEAWMYYYREADEKQRAEEARQRAVNEAKRR